MSIALVTGSAGLVGAATSRFFSAKGYEIVGIDNDMRRYFFGEEASTTWASDALKNELPEYTHHSADIRDEKAMQEVFQKYGSSITAVIHTAAQPSHDWAKKEPITDFSVNANGTLVLLEMTRKFCPDAVFVYTSTNKVYGDTPNFLPLVEQEQRWELEPDHQYAQHGIDESMSIDQSQHSLFGASKAAADLVVQEYAKAFGIKSGCFRGGCLTGSGHAGVELHGFLNYLTNCAISGREYTIFGYKGKQVRDNIHCDDLAACFYEFCKTPRAGEVYNIGGGRHSNCSILEAIQIIKEVSGKELRYQLSEEARAGDHIWWVSDVRKFQSHYPDWKYNYDITAIINEIYQGLVDRNS